MFRHLVDLVQGSYPGLPCTCKAISVFSTVWHCSGVGSDIDDMDQEIGFLQFLERGTEAAIMDGGVSV